MPNRQKRTLARGNYLYAECDVYGVKLTAAAGISTLVVTEPKPIAGNTSHGYITEPVMQNLNTSVNPDFKLEAGKTYYTINSLILIMLVRPLRARAPWARSCGVRHARERHPPDEGDSDREIDVGYAPIPTSISPSTFYNTTGTTNVITVSSARSMTATRTALSIRTTNLRI